MGELPVAGLEVLEERLLEDGDLEVQLAGPKDTTVQIRRRPPLGGATIAEGLPAQTKRRCCPRPTRRSSRWRPETCSPPRSILEVPSLELTLHLRYKSWVPLEEVPEVFSMTPPRRIHQHALAGLALPDPDGCREVRVIDGGQERIVRFDRDGNPCE